MAQQDIVGAICTMQITLLRAPDSLIRCFLEGDGHHCMAGEVSLGLNQGELQMVAQRVIAR
jgi:hypothetical protein